MRGRKSKLVSQGCKGERRTEKARERKVARGRDEIRRATGVKNARAGVWVRTGGGLKGSERLDKSNPLKVRPTLCLPMRFRIGRLSACQIRLESGGPLDCRGKDEELRITTETRNDGKNDDEASAKKDEGHSTIRMKMNSCDFGEHRAD